jgi:hypothetical protein
VPVGAGRGWATGASVSELLLGKGVAVWALAGLKAEAGIVVAKAVIRAMAWSTDMGGLDTFSIASLLGLARALRCRNTFSRS